MRDDAMTWPFLTSGARRTGLLLALALGAGAPAGADDFVDVLASKVWVRKGGLACGNAADATTGATSFFSSCVRLSIAMQVKLIDTPEPMTQVYQMRVLVAGEPPKTAWFSRDSLTNRPKPSEFVPDP